MSIQNRGINFFYAGIKNRNGRIKNIYAGIKNRIRAVTN